MKELQPTKSRGSRIRQLTLKMTKTQMIKQYGKPVQGPIPQLQQPPDQDDTKSATHKGAPGPTPFQNVWNEYVHRVKVHELLRCLEAEQKKLRVLRETLDLKEMTTETEEMKADLREKKIVFQKPLEQEEKEVKFIADEIRRNKEEPDYVSKSVIRLFDNNHNITDEQLERILFLCKDEQERKKLREAFVEKRNCAKYLQNATEDRRMLYNFLNSHPMQMYMLIIIFTSTIVLFLECFETIYNMYSFSLIVLDSVIMGIFIVEAGLKIYIYKDDYFRNPANCLDLMIILTHFVEVIVDLVTQTLAVSTDISATLVFKFLKSLRSLRVLRAIKFLPNLQVIITTIIQSLISISSIAALMLLFIFVFGVAGRELFREGDEKRFGNFLKTCLTLFQLLTLDDWGDILEDNGYDKAMFMYLFLYIVCQYFVFLNLFVAVLVDNFQLSIEAAIIAADDHGEEQKWKDRLLELNGQEDPSSASLHSRHQEPVHELPIEKYMRVDKESVEAKLLAENLKKLAALDFQYFMWNRRMRLTSLVLESATGDKVTIGQKETEISPTDILEPPPLKLDGVALTPRRVPKKMDNMAESNFQLKAKEHKKKHRKHARPGEKDGKSDGNAPQIILTKKVSKGDARKPQAQRRKFSLGENEHHIQVEEQVPVHFQNDKRRKVSLPAPTKDANNPGIVKKSILKDKDTVKEKDKKRISFVEKNADDKDNEAPKGKNVNKK